MIDGLLLAFVIAAMVGTGLALQAHLAPRKESQRRLRELRLRHSTAAGDRVEAQYRKAIAARRPVSPTTTAAGGRAAVLKLRLHRSGKPWTVEQYLYASLGLGVIAAVNVFLQTGAGPLSLGIGLLAGAGLPHAALGRAIGKRGEAFTARFPEAIDLLVRGLRSGLPVTETLGLVSNEVPGPVGEEFRQIGERIRIGRTMDDALQETATRIAMPEFGFFVIALAIQRETGGNLAETLSNLGEVLRKRAQMKLKIRAMSSESKASAYIVGALPFVVFIMIWWINPDYIGGFFSDDRLTVAGLGAMVWMAIGGFVMAKMVSFEI